MDSGSSSDPIVRIQEALDENAAILSGATPRPVNGRRALRNELRARQTILRNEDIATGKRGLTAAEIEDYFALVRGTHPQIRRAR